MTEVRGAKSSVSLVIPSKPEYLALGRLVAGSLGARQGWDEEAITDIKLVVSEVASFFLADSDRENEGPRAGGPGVSSVRMDFEVAPDGWDLTFSNPDTRLRLPAAAFSDPMSERTTGLTIVQALVDAVEQTDDANEGTIFHVHKTFPAAETPVD